MGVSELPLIKDIDYDSSIEIDSDSRPMHPLSATSSPSSSEMARRRINGPHQASEVSSALTGSSFGVSIIRTVNMDTKHDTRVVNEAFQDVVLLLEEGLSSKMQAEMLVLVDVLHKPAAIFQAKSSFRIKAEDKRFIEK